MLTLTKVGRGGYHSNQIYLESSGEHVRKITRPTATPDIEAQIEEIQARRRAGLAEEVAEGKAGDKVALNSLGHYDTNVYTSGDKSGYVTSIPANEDEDVSPRNYSRWPAKYFYIRPYKFVRAREIFSGAL